MTRSKQMLAAALALLALAPGLAGAAACGSEPGSGLGSERGPAGPNILLVTIDTLRADHLSSYGFAAPTTPNMDALAEQGALFARAVAASSSTAPSHASLFTSRYVREHSVGYLNGGTRLDEETTLAEVLRDAGYTTAAFVGNHVLRRELGFDRGFDHYDDELAEPEPNRPHLFERRADETTARAVAWLARAEEPVFLWVHYQDPHGPYDPPSDFVGSAGVPVDPDEEPIPLLETSTEFGGVPAYQVLPGLSRPGEYRARYADEIRYVDHWLGELLGQPQLRDAIVVLTADHGESLGEAEHYFMHGTSSLPAESHVPLLLRAPGIEPSRIAETVSHLDVMPTLLDLVGLEAPPGMRGLALGRFLFDRSDGSEESGEPLLPDRVVYCDMGLQTSAYRGDRIIQAAPAPNGGPRPVVLARRWDATGTPPVDGRGDPLYEDLRKQVTSYLRAGRAEMLELRDHAPDERERLRALGYVD